MYADVLGYRVYVAKRAFQRATCINRGATSPHVKEVDCLHGAGDGMRGSERTLARASIVTSPVASSALHSRSRLSNRKSRAERTSDSAWDTRTWAPWLSRSICVVR